MDKSKFTRDPHLDGEGFLDQYQMAYGCHGCAPDEPCPRSGHCERYDSPLRFIRDPEGYNYTTEEWAEQITTKKAVAEYLLNGPNPKGWQEVDGVTLPETQREAYPGAALVGAMLQRRINATSPWWRLSDPKCAACPTVSPWSRIEQRDLDTVHQLWLAERITPQGGF